MAASSAQAIAALLSGRSAITAIISDRVFRAGGVTLNELQSKITYQSISYVPWNSLDQEAAGIARERFQLNCWGESGAQAGRRSVELANTVKARYADGGIRGFKGTISYTDDSSTTQTLTVLALNVLDSSDAIGSLMGEDSQGSECVSIDIDLIYRE